MKAFWPVATGALLAIVCAFGVDVYNASQTPAPTKPVLIQDSCQRTPPLIECVNVQAQSL